MTHENEKPFPCKFCDKKFSNRKSVRKHEKNQHKGNAQKKFLEDKISEKNIIKTDSEIKSSKNNEKTLHPNLSAKNSKTVKQNDLGKFQCKYCSLRFQSKQSLGGHIVSSHKRKKNKNQLHVENLKSIENNSNSDEEMITSKTIEITPKPKVSKTNNENIIQIGPGKFKCSYCEKVLRNRAKVRRHEISHTDERPFTCEICDKKFKHPLDLKRHRLTHEKKGKVPDSDGKQYVCSNCSQSFKSEFESLLGHLCKKM